MREIKHIFFDLDHTLWDYDRSAQETLTDLFTMLELEAAGATLKKFIEAFYKVNEVLWHRYNHGEIDRAYIQKNRFIKILEKLNVEPKRSDEASTYFINTCSSKPYLMPDAITALHYLDGKYELHIITNGFQDSQTRKLESSGIHRFFNQVITSECTGAKKPDEKIFHYSLAQANASTRNSIMVGDNPRSDISGAQKVGMKSVFYDPSGKRKSLAEYTVQSHLELIKLF